MKIDQERAAHDARENEYRQEMARASKDVYACMLPYHGPNCPGGHFNGIEAYINRRPPQPARDDRGERKAWRPGDR